MRERKVANSGIPGLDKILNGGFLEGSIITVGGPSGSGKSTFAMQYLYEGAIKYNEPGIYISIEETKDALMFNMSGYEWDLGQAEKKQQIIFLDYPVYEIDQFLNQSGAIKEIINSAGVKRVVVDSIMPIALYFKGTDERKKGFLKFIDNVRRWGTTTLIISEDTTPSTEDALPNTTYGIESFTDGWINLSYMMDPKKKERVRMLEVIKMKGIEHSTKRYIADLSEKGFKILVK